jgi:predicted nuclease of predicted toxin-antitoxin system
LIEALRKLGHDVAWIRIEAPGSSDKKVFERAFVEKRILLTFDKDFGELAYRSKMPSEMGCDALEGKEPEAGEYVSGVD